jgi:Mrp family chromosome partitioning ATPase
MSRMLEALKQIEAKRPLPQPPANRSPTDDTFQTESSELHPLIQKELDELRSSPILTEEPISTPRIAPSPVSDSITIDKTLAQAESAAASALSLDEPDIYEEMAQYILAQLTPRRSAVLLFTSPDEVVEKTETLLSLSKTLAKHLRGKVLVLDALPNKGEIQHKTIPYITGDLGRLFEQLKTHYQLVLIDAPSLAFAQTATMLSHCDGAYLVIGLGYATPHNVRESVRVIQQAGARLLGSIATES